MFSNEFKDNIISILDELFDIYYEENEVEKLLLIIRNIVLAIDDLYMLTQDADLHSISTTFGKYVIEEMKKAR